MTGNLFKLILTLFCISMCTTLKAQELTKEVAWAIKYGHTEYLDEWIPSEDINACLEVGSKKTYSYLAVSIKLKSLKSVKYFLYRGAEIEGVCEWKTPLMFAAKYDQSEIAQHLMQQGANPLKTIKGYSAFDYARKFKNYKLYKEMRRNL